jgi:hypothetical protein
MKYNSSLMAAAAILILTNVVPSTTFTVRAPTALKIHHQAISNSITVLRPRLQPLYYKEKEPIIDKASSEHYSVSSLFSNEHNDSGVGVAPIFGDAQSVPVLPTPQALPGDCDVQAYINENAKFYSGDATFLKGPTLRTKKALEKFNDYLTLERENGGVLSVDTETPSTITSHKPGYLLSKEEDIIVGMQADAPLRRTCKPRGGYGVVKKALEAYGYEPGVKIKAFQNDVITHNDLTFSMYTDAMKMARHAHLLTGLPDGYGRGRIIGDYRRIALFGVDELIKRKQEDFASISGSSLQNMRLRSEISSQIKGLKELLVMADSYGVDLRKPAKTFREAVQFLWLGHVAALKEQDGAAMSVGRWDTFLDIYSERDLATGSATEEEIQEIVDDLVLKMRIVRRKSLSLYDTLVIALLKYSQYSSLQTFALLSTTPYFQEIRHGLRCLLEVQQTTPKVWLQSKCNCLRIFPCFLSHIANTTPFTRYSVTCMLQDNI